jgi:hypothetical protein
MSPNPLEELERYVWGAFVVVVGAWILAQTLLA